jgi:hypothetical protein
LRHDGLRLGALRGLDAGSPPIEPQRYAYRSFDRQWVLPDARLGDFMRPRLWRMASSRQIFLTSLLTNVLGPGPAAVATAHVPDMDHFRGSFGARSVIPLWLDAAATRPNVSPAWLSTLSERLGIAVGPDELMCYCYALFGTRGYFARFEEELRTPGPRIPLTINPEMFRKGVALGVELLTIHTSRRIIVGEAGIDGPLGGDFPRDYAYDPTRSAITAEQWRIREVRPDMWDYAVSGYRVLESWLRRRIRPRRGRSVLDAIQPRAWTATLNQELLELIWLIEATLRLEPALDAFLTEVVSDSCVTGRARRC